jgi:hypothetical protein
MPASTPELRCARVFGSLALAVSLVTSSPVLARTSPPATEEEPSAASEPAAETEPEAPGPSEGPAEAPVEAPGEPVPDEPPDNELQPTVTEVEREPAPTGGGVAGAVVDPNDPNATRAQSDLEGEKLDADVEGVPERLPKLQAAGWWTTFTAVALATTGGIFSGVAETREDEAERLAYTFDLETGRATSYGSVADDYERILREGQNYQWVARGFIIAGGATLIASIAVFAVDGARRRRAARSGDDRSNNETARIRLDPGFGGLRLRF